MGSIGESYDLLNQMLNNDEQKRGETTRNEYPASDEDSQENQNKSNISDDVLKGHEDKMNDVFGDSPTDAEKETAKRMFASGQDITSYDKGITFDDISSEGGIEGYRSDKQWGITKTVIATLHGLETAGGIVTATAGAVLDIGEEAVRVMLGSGNEHFDLFGHEGQGFQFTNAQKQGVEELHELTPVHTPDDIAKGSDWDKIKNFFSGGYGSMIDQTMETMGFMAGQYAIGAATGGALNGIAASVPLETYLAKSLVSGGYATSVEAAQDIIEANKIESTTNAALEGTEKTIVNPELDAIRKGMPSAQKIPTDVFYSSLAKASRDNILKGLRKEALGATCHVEPKDMEHEVVAAAPIVISPA